jgi:hypothetical protein
MVGDFKWDVVSDSKFSLHGERVKIYSRIHKKNSNEPPKKFYCDLLTDLEVPSIKKF